MMREGPMEQASPHRSGNSIGFTPAVRALVGGGPLSFDSRLHRWMFAPGPLSPPSAIGTFEGVVPRPEDIAGITVIPSEADVEVPQTKSIPPIEYVLSAPVASAAAPAWQNGKPDEIDHLAS